MPRSGEYSWHRNNRQVRGDSRRRLRDPYSLTTSQLETDIHRLNSHHGSCAPRIAIEELNRRLHRPHPDMTTGDGDNAPSEYRLSDPIDRDVTEDELFGPRDPWLGRSPVPPTEAEIRSYSSDHRTRPLLGPAASLVATNTAPWSTRLAPAPNPQVERLEQISVTIEDTLRQTSLYIYDLIFNIHYRKLLQEALSIDHSIPYLLRPRVQRKRVRWVIFRGLCISVRVSGSGCGTHKRVSVVAVFSP